MVEKRKTPLGLSPFAKSVIEDIKKKSEKYIASLPSTEVADQIAALLNERNKLAGEYTGDRVMRSARVGEYKWTVKGGRVVACVQVKKVQWYQCEVLHLSVAEAHERKGYAQALMAEAELMARGHGARILQCTIRDANSRSVKFFKASGFALVGAFFNVDTGNNVSVFQKVLEKKQRVATKGQTARAGAR